MSLLLALIFLALFISAIVRGQFSYGKADYSFREHPVQFVIVLVSLWKWNLFGKNLSTSLD